MDSDSPLPNVYYAKNQWLVIVYNQNFYEGGGGWRGGSSEGCFQWGGGGGSLRDLSRNISKRGG